MNNFKEELLKMDHPVLVKLGEKIEFAANDLKNNVTNAIKQVENAKL